MSRPTLTTLDHLVLTVTDLERTMAFYTDVLGMVAITFDAGRRRALRFGAHKINLHVQGHEFEPKAFREKPESLIFAKRARRLNVARVSPLADVSG